MWGTERGGRLTESHHRNTPEYLMKNVSPEERYLGRDHGSRDTRRLVARPGRHKHNNNRCASLKEDSPFRGRGQTAVAFGFVLSVYTSPSAVGGPPPHPPTPRRPRPPSPSLTPGSAPDREWPPKQTPRPLPSLPCPTLVSFIGFPLVLFLRNWRFTTREGHCRVMNTLINS